MPGHHVHGAWGPCVVAGGQIYAGTGLHEGRDTEGIILIVSTPAHDLRDYLVYTSDGCWSMAPQLQDWGYQGTVRQLFRDPPKKPQRRNLERLLGTCAEYYCFGNYEGCVSMYVRNTNQRPSNRYALYEMWDATEPVDFWRADSIRYQGRYHMAAWV